MTARIALSLFALFYCSVPILAQEARVFTVDAEGAREIVAEINGGFGTMILKRGSTASLMTIQERSEGEGDEAGIQVGYFVEDGIGYLTVDLGTQGENDLNALGCLMKGSGSRTWQLEVSDRLPVHFNITLGAGKAAIDLTDVFVRSFHLDVGAGSARVTADRPNRGEIGEMSVSAGVGSFRGDRLGNLRFNELDFEGGLGEYVLDCSGALPHNARIISDVGVGSLTVVLPRDIAARVLTDDNWLSSRKLTGFVRKSSDVYLSRNYEREERRVLLDLRSGLGSVKVRWSK